MEESSRIKSNNSIRLRKIVIAFPIMGLMSDAGFECVNEALQRMIQKAHQMGVSAQIDPFVTLSFLALPVIPELRITPRGLCKMTAKGPIILS